MNPFLRRALSVAAVTLVVVAGCKRGGDDHGHAHQHKHGAGHGHGHHHTPPHGGTAVRLGQEAFHLEFVLDAGNGRLSAYILDGHMENFIRSAERSFTVEANVGGAVQTLSFAPVANAATGETVGDTSLFQAEAEWLKSTKEFEAVLKTITIRGAKFDNVAFHFPKGNE